MDVVCDGCKAEYVVTVAMMNIGEILYVINALHNTMCAEQL